MSAAESALEVSLPFTEFEHKTLVITIFNEYKETLSPESSL